MKATIKQLKLFAVFAAMSLMFAENGYSQNTGSDFVRISAVTLERAFYMCDHEVTQKEYQDIMGNKPKQIQKQPGQRRGSGKPPCRACKLV